MTGEPFMFEGELVNGRLSNALWLAKNCPQEFREPGSKWTEYACSLVQHGLDNSGWEWQQFHSNPRANCAESTKRANCLAALYNTAPAQQLRPRTHVAILAWMLSEMLVDAPGHAQPTFQYHGF